MKGIIAKSTQSAAGTRKAIPTAELRVKHEFLLSRRVLKGEGDVKVAVFSVTNTKCVRA